MTDIEFKTTTEITNRIEDLIKESWDLRNTRTQAALELAHEANVLSGKIDYTRGYVYSMRNLAVCNQLLSNYDLSLSLCFEVLPFFEEFKDKRGESTIYSCIGTCFFMMSDHENSLMYHLKALSLREELGLLSEKASSLLNIANVYTSIKDYTNALKYYTESDKIAADAQDSMIRSRVLNGLGGVYSSKGDYNNAIGFFLKSLTIKVEIGDERSMASTLNNIGDCYIELNDFENAQKCLLESFKIAVEYGDKNYEAAYLRAIGKMFLYQHKYHESIDQTKRSLSLYDSLKNKKGQVQCYKLLSDAYLQLGDHKNALECTNNHYKLKEEIYGQETTQRIENINLLRQMELIKSESEIQRLRNVELKKAYEQIEVKNRSILDSIQYAQYIQELLLPSHAELQVHFPESFIYYKPKDIVSGDFFWIHRSGDTVLIAAVDCTGHGVPGAFMSLVSNNMLDVIVKQNGVVNPALILFELNNIIFNTFLRSNDPHAMKGGLDISLCTIDVRSGKIIFAGVHSSIYVISGGEFIEVKGDKIMMGAKPDQIFSISEREFNLGDQIYLFSDGYADQRGGDKRQKFYYPPFKQLLLDISTLSMAEQKTALYYTMNEWMKNEQQMDDMMIVGVRL